MPLMNTIIQNFKEKSFLIRKGKIYLGIHKTIMVNDLQKIMGKEIYS